MSSKLRFLLLLLGGLVTGCASVGQSAQVVTATPDTLATSIILASTPATALPTLIVEEHSPPATLEESPTARPPCIPEELARPRYVLNAALDWSAHTVQVDQQVIYINNTGQPLEQAVFQVEPNRQPGFFTLQGILIDDNEVIEDFTFDLNRLMVPLPYPLAAACQITFNMSYLVKIPPVLDGYESGRLGYWGFTSRQINLGHWMPILAPYKADEWQVPRPHVVGELFTAESSDFEVNLSLANAPAEVDLAAPGVVRGLEENQWQVVVENARDVTLSLSNSFSRSTKMAINGTLIELYFFPASAPPGLLPAPVVLAAAADALVLYEELFGVPYPYERLVIVEGDFPDGMEFSGLVFVGEAWFRTWTGKPNDWLTLITVHEVAHQWWYALVGNNPAAYPYLDEALATYSEYLYFQRYYGDLFDWWWDFRVRGYDLSTSVVDADIYTYESGRPYINGVYLKGAEMLHTLRTQLGDEAFFAWLKQYATVEQHQVATPQDLWGQLAAEQYAEVQPVRQQFLQQPEVLPTPTP